MEYKTPKVDRLTAKTTVKNDKIEAIQSGIIRNVISGENAIEKSIESFEKLRERNKKLRLWKM